jgi:hypothetical protein
MLVEVKIDEGDEIGKPKSRIHGLDTCHLCYSVSKLGKQCFLLYFMVTHGSVNSVSIERVDDC